MSWRSIAFVFLLTIANPCFGEDEPATITITCGDVSLLLRQKSQWTPGRIDFRGQAMTTERSAYGTVFLFPDVGFIGTAHLENEPEDLKQLSFFLDDKELENPAAELKGKTFRFERNSRIRSFQLDNTIELKNNRLYETTRVTADEATPLKLVYHFMHAWRPSVSAYIAGSGEEIMSGQLLNTEEAKRKFHIQKNVDWVGVYEPESQQFAVSRILESPEGVKSISKIWNVSGTYRKYYLTSFSNETVPAGFSGTWKMVTGFGASSPEEWEGKVKALAAQLALAEN